MSCKPNSYSLPIFHKLSTKDVFVSAFPQQLSAFCHNITSHITSSKCQNYFLKNKKSNNFSFCNNYNVKYNTTQLNQTFPKSPRSFNHSSTSTFNCRAQSTSSHETPNNTTATQISLNPTNLFNINFQTLEACRLGIGRYPDFEYNADGGVGTAAGKFNDLDPTGDEIFTIFDLEKLYIPPLTGATTRFLGLPLPPLLKIDIAPEMFEGIINRTSGKVELQFKAKFWFSIGSIYRAPPLMVLTILTSEESKGSLRRGKGERMNREGKCRLVGVATIEPIDDVIMNSFLSLPTECIAELNAQIFIIPAG